MEKGNRMDKREIAAKITQKKEEIKNLISQDKLEDAKNARKEMQELQEKYDLLDEMEKEEIVKLNIPITIPENIKYGLLFLLPLFVFPIVVKLANKAAVSQADKFFKSEWDVFLKKLKWGNSVVFAIVALGYWLFFSQSN